MSGSEQTFSQAAGDLLIEGDLSFSSSATYDQSGGNLVANGTLTVTSATFNHDGGSFSGVGTAIVTDGNINFEVPTPTIPVVARRSNTLAGDIPAGQSLVVQGISANNATLTAANGFTNAGTITLESIAPSSNPSHATLAVTSGVLINAATGVLNFSPGSNQGIRVLDAELFNQGTVNINRTPSFTKPITNEGLFDIVSGVTLTLSGAIQTFTQSAGTLNVNGAMNIASGATLTNDGGSIAVHYSWPARICIWDHWPARSLRSCNAAAATAETCQPVRHWWYREFQRTVQR